MKEKRKVVVAAADDENEIRTCNDLKLQMQRIMKLLDETIFKLEALKNLPAVLINNGEIIRKFLNKTDADFVMLVCEESTVFSKQLIEERPDLVFIINTLDRINMYEKRGSIKKNKNFERADNYEIYVAYAVDVIFKSEPLIKYMSTLNEAISTNPLVKSFLETMNKLREVFLEKLQVSAQEEMKRESDLKTAYRSSMLLSDNIAELEEQLEKQRQELGQEFDRKQSIVEDLTDKIKTLKEKSKQEIMKIVNDSEVKMQKDYNKSNELQEELSLKAKESTNQYETLLQDHLSEEKVLRSKRMKIETQLANWVAKYDQDMGEKHAEFEALEKAYNDEKEKYEKLMDEFNEQEQEYIVLMEEKEEEERRIREEIMWRFLQNSAARKIQRFWRAYRARKLAKKKGRKGKKKGSAGGKKGRKSPKDDGEKLALRGGPDPNALIESKFNTELLADVENKEAWGKKEVEVDL